MADELTVECRRLEWRHDVAARGVQHLVAVARNPAAEQPLLQAKQGTKRNERIKETIGLDNRCKMPLINKYGAVRASTRLPDFSQTRPDFIDDTPPDFPLTLDFNDVVVVPRLTDASTCTDD